MSMNTRTVELILSSAFLVLCLGCPFLFWLRCRLYGPLEFERVRRQGGTVFLGTWLMNAAYWMLTPLARFLVSNRVSPAFLSWLSTVPAAVSFFALSQGAWGLAAWSVLISALLDVLDGAVARMGDTASPAGAILDSTLDRYAEFLFFAGLLVHWRAELCLQLLAFAALAGSILVTYSTAKAEALQLTPPRGLMKRSDRLSCLCIGLLLTSLLAAWPLGPLSEHVRLDVPLIVAVGLIAVLANYSAVQRFCSLARQTTKSPKS